MNCKSTLHPPGGNTQQYNCWVKAKSQWLSEPQKSLNAAQNLHSPRLFQPAIVMETEDSQFILVKMKFSKYPPPAKSIEQIESLTGYKTVSCCDPISQIWHDY